MKFDVFDPFQGMNEGGRALARMLDGESPGKSYAEVMRLRVAGKLCKECHDVYFIAHDKGECVSRLWNGWGRHEGAIGNFGNFLTLEQYRGQGIGTCLLELWYADLQARDDKPLALFCTSAPKAQRMYEKYGMRPIMTGTEYGPSYMPLGNSPADFGAFCRDYYQPTAQLICRPATFAWRHEIDLLLRFALMQKGLTFGFEGMPSLEQALLSCPEKTELLFTSQGKCVGWRYGGQEQVYPDCKMN